MVRCALCPFTNGVLILAATWEIQKAVWVHKACVDYNPDIRFTKNFGLMGQAKIQVEAKMNTVICEVC
jgi:predicted thioredoxin/glutaredoxin